MTARVSLHQQLQLVAACYSVSRSRLAGLARLLSSCILLCAPLLQLFEPAGKGMGYGDLLFTDQTTTRFIHVQIDVFGSEWRCWCQIVANAVASYTLATLLASLGKSLVLTCDLHAS
jgi:hypothetical protein